jgi:hypothetical protein
MGRITRLPEKDVILLFRLRISGTQSTPAHAGIQSTEKCVRVKLGQREINREVPAKKRLARIVGLLGFECAYEV